RQGSIAAAVPRSLSSGGRVLSLPIKAGLHCGARAVASLMIPPAALPADKGRAPLRRRLRVLRRRGEPSLPADKGRAPLRQAIVERVHPRPRGLSLPIKAGLHCGTTGAHGPISTSPSLPADKGMAPLRPARPKRRLRQHPRLSLPIKAGLHCGSFSTVTSPAVGRALPADKGRV